MLEWYNGKKVYDEKTGELIEKRPGLIDKLVREAQEMKESCDLGQRFTNRTFGNFNKNDDLNAFNVCVSFATTPNLMRMERNSLIILGKVGSGKTHLAAAIANSLSGRGIPVMFGTFSNHLEELKREFNLSGERTYLARMKSVPILVIDDIGREKQTDWSRQVLFDVINYRYEHMTPVVVTANFTQREFERYLGADIYSRLCEMSKFVETEGRDHRKL